MVIKSSAKLTTTMPLLTNKQMKESKVINFTPQQQEFLVRYHQEKEKEKQYCYKPMRTLSNY